MNSAVEQSAPVSFEDGELTVAVPTKAGLARLRHDDYRGMIAEKLGKLLGKPVTVTYRLAKKNELPGLKAEKKVEIPPDSGELVASAREHELIRSLMEYIPGTVKRVYPEQIQKQETHPAGKEKAKI